MDIDEILKEAADHLRSGRADTITRIKQYVILPIINSLGWDYTSPKKVIPDYHVDKSKYKRGIIDYALMREGEPTEDRPEGYVEPQVYIELNPLGDLKLGNEEQLFRLASGTNVPFVILTDGQIWNFYLSSVNRDSPSECEFFTMDLLCGDNIQDYAVILLDVLSWDNVISGKAECVAKKMLGPCPREYIPDAWQVLISKYDGLLELLVYLLSEEVQKTCGKKAKRSDVENFLRNCQIPTDPPRPPWIPEPGTLNLVTRKGKVVGFDFGGKETKTTTAIEALIQILRKFHLENPNLMETFAIKSAGKKRILVSKDKWKLYPGRPDLVRKHSRELIDGWWIGTNISQTQIIKFVKIACDVWGVEFKCIEHST